MVKTATGRSATELLLDVLRPDQEAEAWRTHVSEQHIDWNALVVRAIVLGVAPQLHYRLTEWGLELPPRAAAKLAVTYRATAERNDAIYEQLGEVLEVCSRYELRPIALKGVPL